ncbi:hypothetical protein [Rhizobium paknamense]|uniref:Uncharacterized protein n=1 Tax=Rhizobium paknamense TaxID=1206817 RepID=A0ABU0IBJ4_9HYPH|nr:hypothetical protein [Rhizobium paknamense]MDQ0455598.1 hypothetical protein [Rhizobium paknamense]
MPNIETALLSIMTEYFSVRDEAAALRQHLEVLRVDMGFAVSEFYNPRRNPVHQQQVAAYAKLRGRLSDLLAEAERLVRAAAGLMKGEGDSAPEEAKSEVSNG